MFTAIYKICCIQQKQQAFVYSLGFSEEKMDLS